MNGWFPKINSSGDILSGNDGIWLNGQQISPKGTNPFWLGDDVLKMCWNNNDGSTQIGEDIISKAYNEYYSFGNHWTGFTASGQGSVDFYEGIDKVNDAYGITLAKYSHNALVYIAPYQSEDRVLVYNNIPIFQGKILNYVLSPSGLIAWQIATETYTKQILNQSQILSVREDEDPILSFDFLGQSYIVSQIQIGQIVYPLGSHYGYFRKGDLYYPDGMVFGNKLRLVGSDSKGNPLFDNWIDLLSQRINLRTI